LLAHLGGFRKQTKLLLSHFACLLSHFSKSRIHLGGFRKQTELLLSHFACWLSDFSRSRIHLGGFRKQTKLLLAHFACLLSHFSKSRIHFGGFRQHIGQQGFSICSVPPHSGYSYRNNHPGFNANVMKNFAEFAQGDRYNLFLV
jgi:hypothetical protein